MDKITFLPFESQDSLQDFKSSIDRCRLIPSALKMEDELSDCILIN